jgi:protein-disulfide isomerase
MGSRASRKAGAARQRRAVDEQAGAERRRRLVWFAGALAVAVVVVAVAIAASRGGDATQAATDGDPVPAPANTFDGIPQDGAWLGAPSASVVVEEYVDLQCVFCAQVTRTTLPSVVERHVRTGDVRMRLRVLAFLGPDSVEAARFATAAGIQDRQWEFVHAFMDRQGEENSGYVDEAFLRSVAEVSGVDADRAFAAADGDEVTQALAAAEGAAVDAGVQGTPSFRVGRDGEWELASGDALERAITDALRR